MGNPGRPKKETTNVIEDNNNAATVYEVDPVQPGTDRQMHKANSGLLHRNDLTDAEKNRLRMALSDLSGGSQLDVVNGDPNYHYVFAAKMAGHPQNVESCKRLGYEIVNRENNSGEMLPYGDVANTDGGALQMHDLVMMRIPKEYHEARREMIEKKSRERIEVNEEQVEDLVRRAEREANGDNNRSIFVFGK